MFDNSPYFSKHTHSSYESLVDKITFNSKVSYSSVLGDLEKIHLRKPVEGTIDYVVDSLKVAKDTTHTVLKGSIASAAVNGMVIYLARKGYNGDSHQISLFLKDVSIFAETFLYSIIAMPVFLYEKHKEGVPFGESALHLLRFGATGATINFMPYGYRFAKGEVSDYITNNTGMIAEFSSPAAQLLLMYPFALAMALASKPMGYATEKTTKYIVETSQDIKQSMTSGKDAVMDSARFLKVRGKRGIQKRVRKLRS